VTTIETSRSGRETAAGRPERPRISVVVPALNEARNLPFAFSSLPSFIDEVILVVGSSRDDTEAVAQALHDGVRVVPQHGPGKGAALQAGFVACTGDIVVMFDADGSAAGGEIQRFVDALLAGADMAKGSRFLHGGGSVDITLVRRAGNFGLTTLANVLFRQRYTDLCYGFNAFWRDALDRLDVDCNGFEVETLINVRAAAAGLRIAEVPSHELSRVHGASNLRAIPDGMRVVRTLMVEFARERRWMRRR
jgi:glycosyltransferase involved in cell wall biosynthesis